MAHQVQKSRKICGTCAYWGGLVRELNNTYVSVETGFYERCPCLSKTSSQRNLTNNFQSSCSSWKAKY